MSKKPSTLDTVRLVLILALVFLLSWIFTSIIGAPVITILVYFVVQYRRRIKSLEKAAAPVTTSMPMTPPQPEQAEGPTSTDA
jgi:hypothetical protein